jgi:hypothetical protein
MPSNGRRAMRRANGGDAAMGLEKGSARLHLSRKGSGDWAAPNPYQENRQ